MTPTWATRTGAAWLLLLRLNRVWRRAQSPRPMKTPLLVAVVCVVGCGAPVSQQDAGAGGGSASVGGGSIAGGASGGGAAGGFNGGGKAVMVAGSTMSTTISLRAGTWTEKVHFTGDSSPTAALVVLRSFPMNRPRMRPNE